MKELIFETTSYDNSAMVEYAIINKYKIRFMYNGVKYADKSNKQYTKNSGTRTVIPIGIGTSKASGKRMFRGFQVNGTTNTLIPRYKTYLIEEIAGAVTVMDGAFSGYMPFSEPVPENGEIFKPDSDFHMMGGTNSGVNDEIRANNAIGSAIVANGGVLIVDKNQDPGPDLGLVTKDTVNPFIAMKAKRDLEKNDLKISNSTKKKEKKVQQKADADLLKTNKPVDKIIPNEVEPYIDDIEPENVNDIDSNIIKTVKGNLNTVNQEFPDEENKEPGDIPLDDVADEPLQESSGWLKWLEKFN